MSQSPRLTTFLTLAALLVGLAFVTDGLEAGPQSYTPLTQADIDAYVFLLPQLVNEPGREPEEMALALKQSGLSRKRAAYVGAKVVFAQAIVEGSLSPDRMVEENIPSYLQPSAEELRLVSDNLETIKKVQSAAAKAAKSAR